MQAIMKYFADDPNFDDFGNDDNSCYLSITLKFQNFEKISGDSSVLFFLLDTKSFIFIFTTITSVTAEVLRNCNFGVKKNEIGEIIDNHI